MPSNPSSVSSPVPLSAISALPEDAPSSPIPPETTGTSSAGSIKKSERFGNAQILNNMPLLQAIQGDDLEAVKQWLQQPDVASFIDLPDNNGKTALYHAAELGRAGIVEALLHAGADPCKACSGAEGGTPLFVALQENHKDVIDLLLKNKADETEQRNRLAAAGTYFNLAAAQRPADEKPLLALARVQKMQEDFEGALQSVDKAIALKPTTNHVRLKADLLVLADRAAEAEAMLLQYRPIGMETMCHWYYMLIGQKRYNDIVKKTSELAAEIPDSSIPFIFRADAYYRLERYEEALKDYSKVLESDPKNRNVLYARGWANRKLKRYEDARKDYSKALELDPKNQGIMGELAYMHEVVGDLEEAKKTFERILELNPGDSFALRSFSRFHHYQSKDDEAFKRIIKAFDQIDQYSTWEQATLYFARGKAYEKLKEFELACNDFKTGGALKNKAATGSTNYVRDFEPRVRELMARLRPETIARGKSEGHPSEKPVFIVCESGSGSTMLERMLGSHPQIFGAGEELFIESILANLEVEGVTLIPDETKKNTQLTYRERGAEYMKKIEGITGAGSAERIVNKVPRTLFYAVLIALVFPKAPIIYLRRHPMETCVSNFGTFFWHDYFGFTNDLKELGESCRFQHEVMGCWKKLMPRKILDVFYEGLVEKPELEIRRVLKHIGMEWHEDCLHFDKNPQPIDTVRTIEARQPISLHGVDGRWLNYAPYLDSLPEELAPLSKEFEERLAEHLNGLRSSNSSI